MPNITRPTSFEEIIGQKNAIQTLQIAIESANKRDDALGHVLLDAQPGCGKTLISSTIANELGVNIRVILGSNISSFKDILPSLTKLEKREVLFIDEIHTINKKIAESLYTVLEDFRIDIPNKKEQDIVTIKLPRFTMIGATTECGLMPAPLRARFKLRITLSLYNEEEISQIISNNAKKLDLNISDKAILSLAKASRGVPRNANALLEWSRDYLIAKGLDRLGEGEIAASLAIIGTGPDGSTLNDRVYLEFLKKQQDSVGLETISSSTGLDRDTILNVVEPFLLKKGQITKGHKGRKFTG